MTGDRRDGVPPPSSACPGPTTTETQANIRNLTETIDSHTHEILSYLREVQAQGSPHTEAALIRAHAALEDALRHLHEAEAPFAEVSYEGQAITPVRVQDIEDPDKP